jgi:hypothetical protein
VQKPIALDNNTVPMRPAQAAITTEVFFQQQMQLALSSVDNFGKDVDLALDGLPSSADLQAEVRQARSMYERAMEVQESLQKLYRHLRSDENI